MAESCNRLEVQARTTTATTATLTTTTITTSLGTNTGTHTHAHTHTHSHTHMIAGTPLEPPHISCLLKFACTFGPENDCRAAAQVRLGLQVDARYGAHEPFASSLTCHPPHLPPPPLDCKVLSNCRRWDFSMAKYKFLLEHLSFNCEQMQ